MAALMCDEDVEIVKLKMLDAHGDMKVVGLGRAEIADRDPQIEFLTENPEVAAELGKLSDVMRSSFAQAYPGETRTRRHSNTAWRDNGFEYIARVNELMGRSSS